MMDSINIACSLAVSLLVTFVSMPFVRIIAQKIGAMDIPKDNRRMHSRPVPRLGGLAMFYGFAVSVLVGVLCFNEYDFGNPVRGMMTGALIIAGLGLVDDVKALNAKTKLVFQVLAAVIAVYSGNIIQFFTVPKFLSPSGLVEIPEYIDFILSVLWIVGITNAVNLIDGLDGLAAGVSSIASVSLLLIAILQYNSSIALLAAALVGSCIGFLPYNFSRSKVFMGDTGATFLGFILATLSVQGLFKGYAIVTFVIPFLILGLPIFDTGFAILRRLAKGKPIMAPDRGHLHHRLIDMGFSQKQTVAILYSISSLLGLSAVIMAKSGTYMALVLIISVILFVLIGAYFGKMPDINDENLESGENIEQNKGNDGVRDEAGGNQNGASGKRA